MKFGLIIATREMENYDYNSLPASGVGFLAGMINDKLPDVKIILDQNLENMIKQNPDMIGISSVTENYYIAIEWANQIKKQLDVPIIIGGIHITLLPMSIKPCFDIAVLGEGEYTIVEVIESFINNNYTLNFNELEKIHGLFFIKDDDYKKTPDRDIVADLDSLPTLPYDELPFYHTKSDSCIVASRGCPYRCSFCASEKMFRKYRSFSVNRIMEDVRYFIRLGKKHILFYDDLLVADKRRFEKLVIAIEAEKINKKCTFSCQVRANRITPEICMLLKRMNVTDVGIGIESFSDKMLKFYNKSSVTAEVNQKAIDLLNEYEILVNPSIVLGGSVETKEDMLLTMRKIFENVRDGKIESPMWTLLRPYPGTVIWNFAAERNIVGNDMDFAKFRNWSNFELYLCEHVSKNEFIEIIREWIAKITLLYHKRSVYTPETNFATIDRKTLLNDIHWLGKLIKQADRVPELGDDLIVEAESEDNTIFHSGWYPREDNYRWMSGESFTTINSSGKGKLVVNGYIPIDVLQRVYNGSIKLTFHINGKKRLNFDIVSAECEDGLFEFEMPLNKNHWTEIGIASNKTFIPKEHGISNDNRIFSVIIVKFSLL